MLLTPTERYIHDQLANELRPDERILACGAFITRHAGFGAFFTKGLLAALTETRVLMIQTTAGAFAPLLRNQGVEHIAREDIAGFIGSTNTDIILKNGVTVELRKHAGVKTAVPSHARLIALLVDAYGATDAVRKAKRNHWLMMAASVALAIVVVAARVALG